MSHRSALIALVLVLTLPNLDLPAYAVPMAAPRRTLMAGLAWGVAHGICLDYPLERDKIHLSSAGQLMMTLAKVTLDNADKHAMLDMADSRYRRAMAASLAQEVVSQLPPQAVFCVGEEHDSPLHHAAELRLLQALREATPASTPLALGLEMLVQCDSHRQALDDFAKGKASISELHDRTNWERTWGYDIDYYAELLRYARDNQIQMVPLNCPPAISTFAKMLGVQGFLKAGDSDFPEVDLMNSFHREHFMADFFNAKARRELPADVKQNQYEAHTLREEFMAAGAAYHGKTVGGRLMVLSGRSHVEGRYGIPDRIHRRLAKHGFEAPTTMLLQATDFSTKPWWHEKVSKKFADWLWLTDKTIRFGRPIPT